MMWCLLWGWIWMMGQKTQLKRLKNNFDKRKVNHPQCIRPNQPPNTPFEFLPGHKIWIENFIQEVKVKHGVTKNLRELNQYQKGILEKGSWKQQRAIVIPSLSLMPWWHQEFSLIIIIKKSDSQNLGIAIFLLVLSMIHNFIHAYLDHLTQMIMLQNT